MDKSIFDDKTRIPDAQSLKKALGSPSLEYWQDIENFTFSKYPAAITEWKFPGEKHGWSYRVKDKKRVIVYLLPRKSFFKVAMVFGQKATDAILASTIADSIKNEIMLAKPYAEGRGIRIDVVDANIVKDIKELIDIKLAY